MFMYYDLEKRQYKISEDLKFPFVNDIRNKIFCNSRDCTFYNTKEFIDTLNDSIRLVRNVRIGL